MRLHDVAMNDEYFIKRKLAPNVDFWYVITSFYQWASVAEPSDLQEVRLLCITLPMDVLADPKHQRVDLPRYGFVPPLRVKHELIHFFFTGFPLDFFPVLFAVPRVVGWLAHWRQMMLQEGGVKIWRPRQVRGARRPGVPGTAG